MHDSAARAPRGGRERRVSLRKPVVVRSDRRPADRHSGGLLDGPIGFPKAHPSLPPGERAVRVRTETTQSVAALTPSGFSPKIAPLFAPSRRCRGMEDAMPQRIAGLLAVV